MKDVVILAAGLGSRMGKLTSDIPKSVLPLDGESIISRLIRQLKNNRKIDNIVVVAGYLSQVLIDSLDKYSDLIFIENKKYAETNNMWSFCLTRDVVNSENGLITINADCIYSDSIIESIGNCKKNSIYTHMSLFDSEAMKVKVEGSKALGLSKMYEFNIKSKNIIFDESIYWCENISKKDWFEKAVNYCLKNDKLDMVIKNVDFDWVEVDTVEDYERALNTFKK